MSVFCIDFDDIPKPIPQGFGENCAWAAVEIGQFRESILIPVSYWNRHDYHEQWQTACTRLLSGKSPAVFLVDVRAEWAAMDMSFSWVAYRERSLVHVQNTILWPARSAHAGLQEPHLAAPTRATRSPVVKGATISEWHTDVESIRDYAARLESRLRNGGQ